MDKPRDEKGKFIKKYLVDCPYLKDKKLYKHNWYIANKERLQEKSHENYQKNKARYNLMTTIWCKKHPLLSRKYKRINKDRVRFGGYRELVLKRDNYQCQICGIDKYLVVHHIDGSGNDRETKIGKNKANNTTENLITLCRGCHSYIHHKQGEDIVRTLQQCKELGRNDPVRKKR